MTITREMLDIIPSMTGQECTTCPLINECEDPNTTFDFTFGGEFRVSSCGSHLIKLKEQPKEKLYTRKEAEEICFSLAYEAVAFPERFVTGMCIDDSLVNRWLEDNLK